MIPRWIDRDEFPFVVHTHDTPEGRIAYTDEGKGRVLLFVHGNASWSFLYRHLIRSLSKEYRCVAVDHLGFGLSDKPPKADYTPAAHARRLEEFVESLDLREVTLVAHEFGGPIGVAWAMQNKERLKSIVLFNTWLWSLRQNKQAMEIYKIFDHWINRFYYTQLRASPKFFLPILVADVHEMSKHVTEQYLFPWREHKSRQGPYMLARHLIRSSDWLDDLWERRAELEDVPMLLLWGENDEISGEEGLNRFAASFPEARPVRLWGTGNFVPQDAPRRTLIEMRGFLDSTLIESHWPGLPPL
ncbi:MAG TPA: alpha/beta fold hydrolase [Fimbriimonas sp.]|nr:alpha/beta fold hydrolase [Fimbriimonas sp.]